jgi:Mor family transcriptional regulator
MATSITPVGKLAQLGGRLGEAQSRVAALRSQVDAQLYRCFEDGASIATLSRASGLSRETVYKSIERYRVAQLGR